MKTGYARCSTNESKQDIERQVRELKQAGAERVFLEYEHGDAAVKEQLSLLLEQAQAGEYDYHAGGFKACQKHKAVVRDYRHNQSKAAVPCHCRQYHNGLPQRTHRPDDRSVFTDGGRIQPTRTCDDTRARALRNGERQSQGREDRQTGTDRRRYTACFSSALSRIQK